MPEIAMPVAAFLSYIVIMAFTPGPNNLLALANSGRYGFRKGFRFCFGVLLGVMGVMTACAVFSSLILSSMPSIEPGMRVIGAAYIVFLAWTILRDRPAKPRRTFAEPNSITAGVLLQFVNVQSILCGVTAISTFVLPHYQAAHFLAVSVAVLVLLSFAGVLCWSLFGSVFLRLFTIHRHTLNITMSLLLIYCAARLLIAGI